MGKKVIICLIGVIGLLICPFVVKADQGYDVFADIFEKLAPNGEITIKTMKPESMWQAAWFASMEIGKTYKNFGTDLNNCNEDFTECVFSLYEINDDGTVERHSETKQLKIKWQEEYSSLFQKIAPNNELKMKSIKPSNDDDLEFYSVATFAKNYNNISGYLWDCNSDYSICNLEISELVEKDDEEVSVNTEIHKVKVSWEKENKTVKALIDASIKAIELGKKDVYTDDFDGEHYEYINYYYSLEDLTVINYLNNTTTKYTIGRDNSINYVPELKLLFDYSNITYNLDTRMGDGDLFYEMGGGELTLFYKGVLYARIGTGTVSVYKNKVLYIPTNTENTPEAYIKAAKKRLDEYLGQDVKVELAGKRSEIEGGFYLPPKMNVTDKQMGDYYYKITINGVTYDFLIVRDSTKMIINNVVKNIDVDTNVKVETTASDVPSDAVLTVSIVENKSEEHKKITKTIKTELFQAFDISLYSETLGSNITKTEKGEFKITIPVMDELKGKNLMVYYIKDDGSLEEHPVTLDADGNATFVTTHFSTYILAEAININVPKTSDNIIFYITLLSIGIGGIAILREKMGC
ncbi:MAG: hypothetical protein J1F35_07595 [Erysipelotrichales bacterium]|nr:hypothetical protein [Erysipelotrichales bacterium]